MFLKASATDSKIKKKNKGGVQGAFCKIAWSIVTEKGTYLLIFDIFECGAAYGAE